MADQHSHREISKRNDEPSDFAGNESEVEAIDFDPDDDGTMHSREDGDLGGEELQLSDISSSFSLEEEEIGEDGEKKKKKKGKKKCDDNKPTQEAEGKKGLPDKNKEKLPGGKKAEEVASPPPTPAAE
ncbi:dehydrin ERD14-like [Salvia divinorum]|uniref:Dehydrin ERD14-like n=1 Tax=Salvia divinorum TaxID=28513 RepID=A0ABD1HXC5_SALDI